MRALLPVTAGLWCALAVVGATDTFMESRGLGDPNVEDPNTVDAPIIVDKSFSRHKVDSLDGRLWACVWARECVSDRLGARLLVTQIILYVVCGMLALIFSYLCSAVAIIRHTEGVWRLPVGVSLTSHHACRRMPRQTANRRTAWSHDGAWPSV